MTLRELFGITLPIIQAPMAGVQGSALAIAVCKAGGLGSLPCAMLTAETMRGELRAITAQTDAPYNVNFFCHTPPPANPNVEATWRKRLSPYYAEYGIAPSAISAATSRRPFDPDAAALVEELRPPVVSFHFGLPADELLGRVKATGAKVISTATTVEEALWLQSRGVDAIVAQGLEAGGHRGMFLTTDLTTQLGTFALVRELVTHLKVPVIAAGGIADAEGVKAALELGAAGAQVGTAYLLCPESTTSAVHRTALQGPGARHTALTNVFSGGVARGIMNRLMRELGPISADVPPFPLASAAIAPLRAAAERAGSGDFSPLWSGQNASGCKAVPAYDLTLHLAARIGP